jgi:asparagine synthetase B (glutamine-hydrolysing)
MVIMMEALDLHDQFVLARDDWMPGQHWRRHPLRGFHLTTHPSLPVARVLDPKGRQVGFALGWLLDASGRWSDAEIRLPFEISRRSSEDLEAFIYGFGGRYVFVFLTGGIQRLYLDPGGTLGVVYSPDRNRAGSTVTAILSDEPDHRVFRRSVEEYPNDGPSRFYPAGLTAEPEIRRLMPNHYLDLDGWTAARHYPRLSLEPMPDHQIPDRVDRIVHVLTRLILAAVERAPKTYMTLTSGRDSRVLLACARPFHESIEFVTFDYRRLGKRRSYHTDVDISRRLSRRVPLRHRVLSVQPDPSQVLQRDYLWRIGYAGGAAKSQDFYRTCRKNLDLSGAWLTGFGGGVGRTHYWRSTDEDTDMISAVELLRRIGLPYSERFEGAVSSWLSGLPAGPTPARLNLAHLEIKIGCWASPHLYGAAPFSMSLIPFCHREVFDAMLRFPHEYRRHKRLARDLIAVTWPELLKLPFNDYTGPRLWIHRVWRKIRN